MSYTDLFGLNPYDVFSKTGHSLLNLAGFIPIFGDACDAINMIWYFCEGEWDEALLSLVCVLPFIGSQIGNSARLAGKMLKNGKPVAEVIEKGCKLAHYSARFGLGAYSAGQRAARMYQTYKVEGKALDGDFAWNMLGMVLDVATCVFAYKGFRNACNMKCTINQEVVYVCTKKGECFVAGTKIKTEDGNKNIEDIEAGDLVYARNTETGEEGYKEVVQVFHRETTKLVHLQIGDTSIDTTPTHPFWIEGYGFKAAGDLKVGDVLRTASGELKKVTFIEVEELEEPVTVYNFEVKDWHTYYVSEDEILVHNRCPVETNNGKSSRSDAYQGGTTPEDIHSFGNKSEPRGARPKQDFGVDDFDDVVGYNGEKFPLGASNVSDVNNAPLSGHYHTLPKGTQLPDGLSIKADGCDIFPDSPHGPGHYTIYPSKNMTVSEFNELYKSLPWTYGGKK